MDAGRLDARIVITRASGSPDGFNEPGQTWGTLATVWCKTVPVSDGERWQAGQTLANETIRFTIRWAAWVADVNPRDRIQYEGRTFDIQGVKDLGRREYREITAIARAE
jgi:SPP1 family predicted phage head-tail adaptor